MRVSVVDLSEFENVTNNENPYKVMMLGDTQIALFEINGKNRTVVSNSSSENIAVITPL